MFQNILHLIRVCQKSTKKNIFLKSSLILEQRLLVRPLSHKSSTFQGNGSQITLVGKLLISASNVSSPKSYKKKFFMETLAKTTYASQIVFNFEATMTTK